MAKRSPLTFDLENRSPSTPAKPAKPKTGLQKNTQTRKHANETTPAKSGKISRDGRKLIAVHMVPEAAKQFKLIALQQERTIQVLLLEAVNDLFAKYGFSRIAE